MADPLPRQHAVSGELIFREGDGADCAYVIETGEVVITTARGHREIELAKLAAGDVFGEMALIDDTARSATARVTTDTTLVVIRRDQVMRRMESADPLIQLFLRVVLQRLRRTSGLVGEVNLGDELVAAGDSVHDTGYRRLHDAAIAAVDRERSLEQALERRELEAFFQPMVDVATGCVAGFEAVLRWRLADGTTREPATFLALAEEAQLMRRLTAVVLEQACRAITPLQAVAARACPGAPPPFVSFNLSAPEVADPTVVDDILAALRANHVDPGHLQVEVTESVLMRDPDRTATMLRRLKQHGIAVEVDDFGTGYSSLSYLQHLPIDVLKIDRSFIAALPGSARTRKIVRAVTYLARELGLLTVAEGVESPEELAQVSELGCNLAQGFLFSPPLPLEEAKATAARRFALVHAS